MSVRKTIPSPQPAEGSVVSAGLVFLLAESAAHRLSFHLLLERLEAKFVLRETAGLFFPDSHETYLATR